MDQQERQVIDDLFGKLQQAEGRTGPRDPEAEALIRQRMQEQPGAPYYMAQALVVQQDALASAQGRIQQLEQQLAARPEGGGFLAGLFGGTQPSAPSRAPATSAHASRYQQQAGRAGPWGGGGSGGFLAGAMQTALGVAGGVMIADALMGAFGADEAMAGEMPEDAAADAGVMEDDPFPSGDDFGGGDLGGGDFGDF